MKKSVINIIALVFLGIVFISCDKEDTKETPPPTIEFKSGLQPVTGFIYVSHDTTLIKSSKFVIGIKANTVSGENLKRLYIQRKYESEQPGTICDITFDTPSIDFDTVTFAYASINGSEDFTCTVWDKNDQFTSIGFTVTLAPPASDIITYSDIILGSQFNLDDGSFFSTINGLVYDQPEAKLNYELIDFLYYNNETNYATLAAPNDAGALNVYNNATNGLQTWTFLNPTKFKTTGLSSTDFDAIQSSNQIIANAYNPAPTETSVTNLTNNKVLAFKTADDEYGLIRIDNITTTGPYPSIKITVKVPD